MEGGLMSAQQFEDGARGFAQLWEACGDAEQLWTWVPSGNELNAGYLHLEGVPQTRSLSSEECTHSAAPLCSPDDPDESVAWQPSAVHLYSFSIVYQPSYSVPVLLFQGRDPDGAPLSWEETLLDLPEAAQETARRGEARWSFITQQEHPVTRVPMHGIHPCETAKLMSLLMAPQDSPHAAEEDLATEARSQHAEHLYHSMIPEKHDTGELAEAAHATREGAKECKPGIGELKRVAPNPEELRYMRGWYSIVAPVVGLPQPLGLYGKRM